MITVRNAFHNSKCRLRVASRRLSRRQILKCRAALCPSGSDCLCSGILKNRGARSIVDDEGREYCVARLGKDAHENPYVQLELVDEPAA